MWEIDVSGLKNMDDGWEKHECKWILNSQNALKCNENINYTHNGHSMCNVQNSLIYFRNIH